MKRALFYAAGSAELGYGHLYRILGILNDLKSNLFYTVFVTNDVQEDFCNNHGIRCTKTLPDRLDLLVIDSKEDVLPFSIHSILNDCKPLFIAIDTFCDWRNLADFIISPTFYSEKMLNFSEQQNFIGGREFVSIRPGVDTPLQVRDILVTFGGSDPNNITKLALDAITELNLQEHTNVILGPGYKGSFHFMKRSFPKVHFYSSVDATIEFVRNSNIVVTALGTTVNEIEFTKRYGFLIFNYSTDECEFPYLLSASTQQEKWISFGMFSQFDLLNFKLQLQKYISRGSAHNFDTISNLNKTAQFISHKLSETTETITLN
jgi:spore coat polysaccharide biosynthesis predicted glycosyltransferase SpsG